LARKINAEQRITKVTCALLFKLINKGNYKTTKAYYLQVTRFINRFGQQKVCECENKGKSIKKQALKHRILSLSLLSEVPEIFLSHDG
jgi:hypothetical protein